MSNQSQVADRQLESSDKAWEDKLLAMPASDYMNDEQLAFFRQRLLDERADIEAHLKAMKDVIALHERDIAMTRVKIDSL